MISSAYRTVIDLYNEFMESGDPRVTPWLLVDRPGPVFATIALYLAVVKFIGPALMRNKKPFELRYVMIIYNLGLVCFNIYLLIGAAKVLTGENKKWLCRIDDDPYSYGAIRATELGWWFYFLKYVEFLDTIFFVLRKKDKHISTLHIVHHTITPIGAWILLRVEPGNTSFVFPLINTFVHVIMYSYYGLAAMGPAVQKYLWWKKYLTTLQISQFVVALLYVVVLLATNCKVSNYLIYTYIFFAGVFLVMFMDFFYKTYVRQNSRDNAKSENGIQKMNDPIRKHTSLPFNGLNRDSAKTKTG